MKETNSTIDYYNKNAERYCQETFNVKIPYLQYEFLLRTPVKGKILDLGCGSGRDSKFFINHGYQVIAVDCSSEMCKLAEKNIGQPIICKDLREYEPEEHLAGIWANASLLHLAPQEIKDTVARLTKYLLPVGCFYMSFKYGIFFGKRDGRFYTDVDETSIKKVLDNIPELCLVSHKISEDVRSNHVGEKWLNIFCIKKNDETYAEWKNEEISEESFRELCKTGTIDEIIKAINEGSHITVADPVAQPSIDILRRRIYRENCQFRKPLNYAYEIARKRALKGNELIFSAIKACDAETVQILIELGVNVNYNKQEDKDENNTPLTLAVRQENLEIVKIIMSRNENNIEGDNIKNALSLAVRNKNINILKVILDYNNDKAFYGGLALCEAVSNNALEIVDFFLKYGIDANVFEGNPLRTAVIRENLDMIKLLVNNGADIGLKDEFGNGNSAFDVAIEMNALDIIDFFLSISKPCFNELVGGFWGAIIIGNIELSEKFWKLGASLNHAEHGNIDRYGFLDRSLRLASTHRNIEIMKILLHYGANVNSRGSHGTTALMLASGADAGYPQAVQILIDHGADVNAINDFYETALNIAYSCALNIRDYNKIETIKILLRAGADTDVIGNGELLGETILKKLHDDAEIVRLTIRNCKDYYFINRIFSRLGISEKLKNNLNEDWATAIAMTAYNGEPGNKEIIWDIVVALAEFKEDQGWTALMCASAFCENSDTIFALIDAKDYWNINKRANESEDWINKRDHEGWTALMYAAAFNDSPEIISALIYYDYTIDLKAINDKGETALDLARENKNNPAIELLEAAEAKKKSNL